MRSSQNSKSSSLERKFTREVNIREIKEADVENTDRESDSDRRKESTRNIEYFIGDGKNLGSQYYDQPMTVEQLYQSNVR